MKSKNYKTFFLDVIKGSAIGISMIIPGFSGGTIAVLLNIYDKILDSITGIFKNFKKSILTLLPLMIGAIIGFAILVFPLELGLLKIPLIITSLFVGFIIGGLPCLYRKVQRKENIVNIIIFIIALCVTISLCFIKSNITINLNSLDICTWLYLLLSGFLASIALVAPGISGSMTLMVLGVYANLIVVIKELMTLNNIIQNIMVIIPVGVGILVGFFLISLLMKYLLKKHETPTYFAILGFIIGSIVPIYYIAITESKTPINLDLPNIIFSFSALIIGVIITYLIERLAIKTKGE